MFPAWVARRPASQRLIYNSILSAVVIVFHQAFEGLGLGSRLAFLKLPAHLNWVPFAGALLYSICTPVGIAAGLGAPLTRTLYYFANRSTRLSSS
jgi:hypothetical protein